MDYEKIISLLGVTALDESIQETVISKLETLVEAKVNERLEEALEEAKEELVESYEMKFDKYKDEVLSRFSDFMDNVLEEEMQIPERVLEYARKGELYEDVIQTLKTRIAIDEGILDPEIAEVLAEAKEEILVLRDELNETMSEQMDARELLKEARAELYLTELCEDLDYTDSMKMRVMLEGVTDLEEMEYKFGVLSEAMSDGDKSTDADGVEKGRKTKNKTGKTSNDEAIGDGEEAKAKKNVPSDYKYDKFNKPISPKPLKEGEDEFEEEGGNDGDDDEQEVSKKKGKKEVTVKVDMDNDGEDDEKEQKKNRMSESSEKGLSDVILEGNKSVAGFDAILNEVIAGLRN